VLPIHHMPKPKKTKRGDKPKDAITKSKTYNLWILKSDIEEIKRAIHHTERDYKPTSQGIVRVTGMKLTRVRALLKYLQEQGQVKVKIGKDRKTVYRWGDKE